MIYHHPLSALAIEVLRDIAAAPVPRSTVNPGVSTRLRDEGLVEEIQIVSPFPTHKGRKVTHLQCTDAGRKRLDEIACQK